MYYHIPTIVHNAMLSPGAISNEAAANLPEAPLTSASTVFLMDY